MRANHVSVSVTEGDELSFNASEHGASLACGDLTMGFYAYNSAEQRARIEQLRMLAESATKAASELSAKWFPEEVEAVEEAASAAQAEEETEREAVEESEDDPLALVGEVEDPTEEVGDLG